MQVNMQTCSTFTPSTTDDKERDEILHQKISIFRWIRAEHLDIPDTTHNESFLTFAESGNIQFIWKECFSNMHH